jgi:hypothetical protein
LKSLLIEKFQKLFPILDIKFITEKVSIFIQSEKLTEHDLKSFEEKLKIWASNRNEEEKIKKCFEREDKENLEIKNTMNYLKNEVDIEDRVSVSKMSEVSSNFGKTQQNHNQTPGIKYDEITSFPLRKLLQSERQPLKKEDFSKYPDEWTAIEDHKNKVWDEEKKETRLQDKLKKNKTKETYLSQMQEKDRMKQEKKKIDNNYHRTLIYNLDKDHKEELKKSQAVQEKVNFVKEMQDEQMKDNILRKKKEFLTNREYDNKLSTLF